VGRHLLPCSSTCNLIALGPYVSAAYPAAIPKLNARQTLRDQCCRQMRVGVQHQYKIERSIFKMNRKFVHFAFLLAILGGLLVPASFATTNVTSAVVPSIAAPHSKVFIHTAVRNASVTAEAVTVSIKVTNPGACVSGNLPSNAGAFAIGLRPNETRLADLSLDVSASACSGTYTVAVTVKNSSGALIASHTTTFTVDIPTP